MENEDLLIFKLNAFLDVNKKHAKDIEKLIDIVTKLQAEVYPLVAFMKNEFHVEGEKCVMPLSVDEQVILMTNLGMSSTAISKKLGVNPKTIRLYQQRLKREGKLKVTDSRKQNQKGDDDGILHTETGQ